MRTRTKTFLAFIVVVLAVQSSRAQIYYKTKGKNVEKLYNQKVIVYSYGNGSYNNRLTNAFKNYWKVTPFEIRDASKPLPTVAEGSTIFMPAVVGLNVRDHATSINHPFFVYGESNTSGSVNGEGIIAAFPVNGFHYEFDVTADSMFHRSLLRVPYIVQTLNDMASYLKANGSDNGYFKTIDARSSRIAGKTLLIPQELVTEWDVNPNSTALMKANLDAGKKSMKKIMAAVLDQSSISFNGRLKIMPSEKIMELEESAEAEKYTIFLPAINNKKYIMVFDLKTKELLYYEYANMGMKIKEKDFDKLNKAAGL